MSETEEQLRTIRISMEDAQNRVKLRDTARLLAENPLFKEVIKEGFFEKEAIRLVHLKSASAMQSPEAQEDLDRAIFAVGILKNYLYTIEQLGNQAEAALAADRDTERELYAEQAEAAKAAGNTVN